jgi:hypothetical protein
VILEPLQLLLGREGTGAARTLDVGKVLLRIGKLDDLEIAVHESNGRIKCQNPQVKLFMPAH